jgi:putative PIN family toxin of toxin-antitoxin system
MSEKFFVLDTNLLISAILVTGSTSQQVFDKAIEAGKILQSQATLEEIATVILRPKFNKYLTLTERELFLKKLRAEAQIIDVAITITECRDAKDNKFLELAISGNADYIISGDDDLLVLHPFRGIPILAPRLFLDSDI